MNKSDPMELIERALSYDLYNDLEAILAAIAGGKIQQWIGERSFLLTEIRDHPKCRSLQVVLAGGDLDEIITTLRPEAEQYGREMGCTRVHIEGRRGWAKALKSHGYTPKTYICEKAL